MRRPSGSDGASAATARFTAPTTVREFSPRSMIAMPATVSPSPSRVTAPWRGCGRIDTSATSRSSTGVPSAARSTTAPTSAVVANWPTPRMYICSHPLTMKEAPALALARETAVTTSRSVSEYLTSSSGRTTTWYCFTSPPMLLTSVIPGTVFRRGLISQSWIVRFSIAENPSPSSVYWKISPSPVDRGASSASTPAGSASRAPARRSNTSWRAKYGSTASANTTITCARPARDSERTCMTRGRPLICCSIG